MVSSKISSIYSTGTRRIRLLLGVLVGLVVADGLLSKFLITNRFAREGNPLLEVWVGENVFLVIKLVAAFLVAFVLWDIYKRYPRLSMVSTICFVIAYTALVFWSLYVYFLAHV